MMHLVYDKQEKVKAGVAAFIPHMNGRGVPKNSTAIGVADDDGLLVGGFVYHDWNPDAATIEITGAAVDKHWLTRKTLWGLFSYPFLELGCQLVVMRVLASDKPLGRMLAAYGFKSYPIPRIFGRLIDGVVYTLTVEDWKANGFHKELH